MRRLSRFLPLLLPTMLTPATGGTQASMTPIPRATVREVATVDGYVDSFARLPNGRVVLYAVNDSTFAHDVASKRRTLLGTDMVIGSVSPQGDRLVFTRRAEDGSGTQRLWTIPINPQTGIATGAEQLVSPRPKRGTPKFSPDGRLIAFWGLSATQSGSFDLLLIPPTGGAERLVGTYGAARSFGWSADGLAIDVDVDGLGIQANPQRIVIDGGGRHALFPLTEVTSKMTVGVLPGGTAAIFTSNPDVFLYRTAAGAEGQIDVSLPALDDAWGFDFSLDRDSRYLTTTYNLPERGVRVLDMEAGRTRTVLPNETSWLPAWSTDGRRLAVLTGNVSHYDVAIMNADGSGLRRYPMSMTLGLWTSSSDAWWKPWSPDGRHLAFYVQSGSRVGWTRERQRHIAILDVASGATRVLVTSPREFYRHFQWRPDGKALRFITGAVARAGTREGPRIVEVDLEGRERVLRDLSAEFPGMTGVFLGSHAAAVSVRVGENTERFAVPLGSGAARRLPDSPETRALRGGGANAPGVLLSEESLALFAPGENGTVSAIHILSSAGEPPRTIRMPFANSAGTGYPDGKAVVVNGKVVGDSLHRFFFVSLEDGAQRMLGAVAGGGPGVRLAASPDRKFVAYVHNGPYTSTIHEIDFGPAIRAIVRR